MKTVMSLLVLVSTASAAELTDPDNDFVVTVPADLRTCIALPVSRRNATACAGKPLDRAEVARADPSLHTMAFLDGDGLSQEVAIAHKFLDDRSAMTREQVERAMNAAIAHAARKGAMIRGWDTVRVAGVPAWRYVTELGQARGLTYALQGRDGLTWIYFISNVERLAATEQLANRLLATARIKPPAAAPKGTSILPTVMTLALVTAAAALALRRRFSRMA
jgi:hypothetical protein